ADPCAGLPRQRQGGGHRAARSSRRLRGDDDGSPAQRHRGRDARLLLAGRAGPPVALSSRRPARRAARERTPRRGARQPAGAARPHGRGGRRDAAGPRERDGRMVAERPPGGRNALMNAPGRRLVLGAGLGVAAAAAGLWLGLRRFGGGDRATTTDPTIEALFGLSLPDLTGEPVELARFRGRTVVFNFWATWCAPCIEEMPELSAMQEDLGARGVQVLGIGIDSDANIRKFAEKYPVSYPLLVASGSA